MGFLKNLFKRYTSAKQNKGSDSSRSISDHSKKGSHQKSSEIPKDVSNTDQFAYSSPDKEKIHSENIVQTKTISKQKDQIPVKSPKSSNATVTEVNTSTDKNGYGVKNVTVFDDRFSMVTTLKSGKRASRSKHKDLPFKINNVNTSQKNYVVVDTETTGTSIYKDRVVQLAAIKFVDDKVVDTFNEYINPGNVLMNPLAQTKTGITNKALVDKPSFVDVLPKFDAFVGDNIWVGHNIKQFDIPILFYNGYRQHGNFKVIDTWPLSQTKMAGVVPNFKLDTLKNYFNLIGKSHDALGDCAVTAEIYKRLRDGNLTPNKLKTDKRLANKRFCITGTFKEASKDDIKKIIEQHGGRCTKNVSGKTDYLIDGIQTAPNIKGGKSSKERDAEKYGTAVITYQNLMKMLSDVSNKN